MGEFARRYESAAPTVDLAALPYWDLWADRRLGGRIPEWGLDEATQRSMEEKREAFVAQARSAL
jgi:hypothetical protein